MDLGIACGCSPLFEAKRASAKRPGVLHLAASFSTRRPGCATAPSEGRRVRERVGERQVVGGGVQHADKRPGIVHGQIEQQDGQQDVHDGVLWTAAVREPAWAGCVGDDGVGNDERSDGVQALELRGRGQFQRNEVVIQRRVPSGHAVDELRDERPRGVVLRAGLVVRIFAGDQQSAHGCDSKSVNPGVVLKASVGEQERGATARRGFARVALRRTRPITPGRGLARRSARRLGSA